MIVVYRVLFGQLHVDSLFLALSAGVSRGDRRRVAGVVCVEVVSRVGGVDGEVDAHELHAEHHVPGPLLSPANCFVIRVWFQQDEE